MSLQKRLQHLSSQLGILSYSDYRIFLGDLYVNAKDEEEGCSFARFSEALGLGSKNAHSIIRGHRRLGVKAAEKVARRLGCKPLERRYLLALVGEEAARTPAQREEAFAARFASKRQSIDDPHSQQQLAFFEHWHHGAILELLRLEHASDDPQWIAGALSPTLPVGVISESLTLLRNLTYLTFDPARQRLYPSSAKITSSADAYALARASFHRQMLSLAAVALDHAPPNERLFGALTLAIPHAQLPALRSEIIALRDRLQQLALAADAATSLVQVNFQLFPLLATPNVEPLPD